MISSEEFAEHYTRHFGHVVGTIRRRTLTLDEAQDIAQEAWTRGWEKRAQYNGTAQLHTWITKIALNELFDRRRRLARYSFCGTDSLFLLTEEPHIEQALDTELLLQRCKPKTAQLLTARYVFGHSTEEMAHARNRSNQTIKINLMNARREARAVMAAHA